MSGFVKVQAKRGAVQCDLVHKHEGHERFVVNVLSSCTFVTLVVMRFWISAVNLRHCPKQESRLC